MATKLSNPSSRQKLAPTAGATSPPVYSGDLGDGKGSRPTNPLGSHSGEPLNRQSSYSNAARYLKGSLISYDPGSQQVISKIAFQYNPQELSRSLKPRAYQGKQGKDLIGAPEQSINTTVRLQAVDRMIAETKNGQPAKAGLGLYAQLAALELLLYPQSSVIDAYRTDLDKGTKGAVPASAYPVLFQWGPQRLLPVRLTSMEVKETLFNIALSPIAADVTLAMAVEYIIEAKDMAYTLLQQNLMDLESIAEYDAEKPNWRVRGGY